MGCIFSRKRRTFESPPAYDALACDEAKDDDVAAPMLESEDAASASSEHTVTEVAAIDVKSKKPVEIFCTVGLATTQAIGFRSWRDILAYLERVRPSSRTGRWMYQAGSAWIPVDKLHIDPLAIQSLEYRLCFRFDE